MQTNEDYDKTTYDLDEGISTDIKINPDFYIHHALVKAQNTFLKDNMKEGFTQYILFIEHIETLCRSARFLQKEYEDALEKYRKSKEYTDAEDKLQQRVRLANKKLGLMMEQVFDRKVATDPLVVSFKEEKENAKSETKDSAGNV
jgi:hypothetical protein